MLSLMFISISSTVWQTAATKYPLLIIFYTKPQIPLFWKNNSKNIGVTVWSALKMSKIILLYMKRIQIYLADLPISASHQCRHAIIYFHIAKNRAAIHSSVLKSCGRWDLNPHKRNAYKILSLARLPVPTLPHIAFHWKFPMRKMGLEPTRAQCSQDP